jgi:hypothetical protein
MRISGSFSPRLSRASISTMLWTVRRRDRISLAVERLCEVYQRDTGPRRMMSPSGLNGTAATIHIQVPSHLIIGVEPYFQVTLAACIVLGKP